MIEKNFNHFFIILCHDPLNTLKLLKFEVHDSIEHELGFSFHESL